MWYRQIQLEKFHAGEAIEVSLASIYRWDVRRTDDLTINKGGGRRRQRCKVAAVDGGVDTWSRDEHGRDGEASVGVGYSAIGSRRREPPHGNDERGQSGRFDGSWSWERRVIGRGEGMQGSEEGGGSRTRRGVGSTSRGRELSGAGRVMLPKGRRSGRLQMRRSGRG